MKTIRLLYLALLACLTTTVCVAGTVTELEPKTAVRLLALKTGQPENSIEIPFILEGSSRCPEGFEARHVRRVAAIMPVRSEARQSRELVFHEMHWNEALGWFMWESRTERAGDAVYIWSERKGAIVNR
jgi:hypothetical protein